MDDPAVQSFLTRLGNWNDPYPKPVIEQHEGFNVVRDDLLVYGSKIRFIDYLIGHDERHKDVKEWVFGGANKIGYGPIALTKVCKDHGKEAVFFMAERAEPTEQQQMVLDLGGKIKWVKMGMLNVTLSHARKYYEEDMESRRLLPLGLEDPMVLASIIKVARDTVKIDFPEIWTVGSSGTLSRGLQLAFPEKPVNIVQTGHTMTPREIGRAKLYVSPYKFDKAIKTKEAPPYPASVFYDAKVWPFVKQYGKPGALVWNVA